MCRNVIPNDYLNNPVVLAQDKDLEENRNEDYQWYYEGGNGELFFIILVDLLEGCPSVIFIAYLILKIR